MDKRDKFPKSAEVEGFKQTILKTAEELVVNKFPKRITQLNKMLSAGKLTNDPKTVYQKINIPVPDMSGMEQVSNNANQQTTATQASSSSQTKTSTTQVSSQTSSTQPGPLNGESGSAKLRFAQCPAHLDSVTVGTKVLVLPDGVVASNCFIVELINEIKPLIEDGNNFGVSIQEDVLAEIRASEGEAAAYYDQISRYFSLRGKTVSKVAQYPHIEDYRRAIQELDEKEFFSLRLIVAELRNHYATLHDLISKNGDKIRKPRSSNTEHMF